MIKAPLAFDLGLRSMEYQGSKSLENPEHYQHLMSRSLSQTDRKKEKKI